MKTRETIQKITEQQDKLHRGRAVVDAMREAEELGHQYRHGPQWQQDLSKEQVNKRRHALQELVRTNRDPRQNVNDFFPGNIAQPVHPAQLAAAGLRGVDPIRFAGTRAQAPQRFGLGSTRHGSAPAPSVPGSRASPRVAPASARPASSTSAISVGRLRRELQRRLTPGSA